MTLRDNGTLFNGTTGTSSVTVNYGTLNLDNGGFYDSADRLASATPVSLQGGTLALLGGVGFDSAQSAGAVTVLSNGASTLAATPGTGGSAKLTIASLTRSQNSVVNFTGSALGYGLNTAGTLNAGNSAILITSAPLTSTNLIGGWAVVGGTCGSAQPGGICGL